MGNVSVMWLEYNCKEQYKISDWVFGCMGSLSEKKNNDTYLHIEEREGSEFCVNSEHKQKNIIQQNIIHLLNHYSRLQSFWMYCT